MFGKKAQGLSMNTIIIAAIALVVLVVLIVLVMNYTGKVPEATGCENQGGICTSEQTGKNKFQVCEEFPEMDKDKSYAPHVAKCGEAKPICCIGI